MNADEWNSAYVTHLREIIALIKSMEDKSAENIIDRLETIAKAIEGEL